MKVAFLGNGTFGLPIVAALTASDHDLVAVVTRPDRPAGRGRRLEPSPTKQAAMGLGVPVVEIDDLKAPATREELAALKADCWVVVAFPILPTALLDVPARGIINLHASLLPAYRGAAPIQWALINGERVTGVTTFFIDAGVDTGAVCLQREVTIEPEEDAGELADRLARVGAELMLETIDRVAGGDAPRLRQDPALATPAPRLRKEDGEIDWERPAVEVVNRIRGLNPWPGTWTWLEGERLIIHRARKASSAAPGTAPGTVTGRDAGGFPVVAAGDGGGVVILEAQRAGRRPVGGDELARGLHWQGGERLGTSGPPDVT